MGHMKDFDRRIRQGGDDAIAAVSEYVEELEGEVASARACAEMMLQGTGQKLGEELARRVMDEHYPPRWIPVGERLPEEGVVVLAYLPKQADVEGGVYAAMLSKLQTLRGTFSTSFGFGFEATHWMPLPAPPADAK